MFDEMSYQNLISWTSIISAYSQNRHEDEALDLYLRMLQEGLSCSHPDGFCLGSVVRSCVGLGDVELGRQLHCQSVKFGCTSDLIVQNALVTMYFKLNRVGEASVVFEWIKDKDLVSWGSIISGFTQGGFGLEALLAFKEMVTNIGIIPNQLHFGSAFSACASVYRLEFGEQIHGLCVKFGLESDPHVGCSLSDMYARVGHLGLSKKAFRQIWMPDLVSWNSIISAFANGGFVDEVILFFTEMRDSRLKPDDITVRCIFCACMDSDSLFQGQMLHSYVVKMGLVKDVAVCNSLLAMYSKCADFSTALTLFQELHENRDLVSWNTILTSCLQHQQPEEVFRLFNLMRSLTVLDHITLNTLLSACGELAYLEMGNQVHPHALKLGLEDDQVVRNILIDTYAKCGSLDIARKLFELMGNDVDVFSWSSLIVGHAQFGHGKQALDLFTSMIKSDVKPNHITFVGVLSACSRVGLVDEGCHYFNVVEVEYGIVPTREHCSCVVDLLARAGKLDETKRFIDHMPLEPDIVMWKTLLSACRVYKNVEIAKKAAEGILEIDPSNSAAYVLLCNTLASSGCWDDVARLRKLMRSNDVKKSPGKSWIKVKWEVKVFIAEDKSHPETDDIYVILDVLELDMGKAGCAPIPSICNRKFEPCYI